MPDYFYYTYGGFDTIANALRSLSLIFGNSSFQGIFFTAMVLGLALGIMAFYIRVLSGAQLSPMSLVVTFVISISLYMGLFVPKCRVHVEDKTTGKFQVISGIPLGIGATLGVLNKIEVGINEDIIQPTFGVFYRDSAGGRGIEAILYLLTSGLTFSTKNQALDQTIRRYFNDCVVFEAGRPNGSISVHGIMNGSIPLETAFANSASPAVWTIDYIPPASNAGTPKTCDDVWRVLNPRLSDPSFVRDAFLKPTCAAAGFDISDAYYWSCIRVLSGHLAWLASAPGTKYDSSSLTRDINTFARRTYLASMIAQVVERNGVVPFANIQMLQQSTSTALVLNNWLPYIKAATTSIFILITPFVLIFLPTPLFGRALSLVVGLFIWLTVWSIVDALAHNSLTFYISSAFEKFRESFADLPSYQYGLTAIYQMRDPLYKSLAFLGYIRGAGVVLTSAIAYGLFRFGGYAFTQFASGLQQMTARAGYKAADQVMNPAGARSTQNANLESSAYWGTAFEQRRAAAQGHVGWGIASGMAQNSMLGMYGMGGVTSAMANNLSNAIGRGAGYGSPQKAYEQGRVSTMISVGETQQREMIAHALFNGDVEKLGKFIASGGLIDNEALAQKFRNFGFNVKVGDRVVFSSLGFGPDGSPVAGEVTSGKKVNTTITAYDGSTSTIMSLTPSTGESSQPLTYVKGSAYELGLSGDELMSAKFDNIDNRFAKRIADSQREIASKRLTDAATFSTKTSFSLSKLDSLSKTNQTAKTISDSVQQALTDRILKDSSFKTVKSNETQDSLYASVSAGLSAGAPLKILGIQAGVKGGYDLRAKNSKGEMLTFDISQSQAEDLTRTVGKTVSNTLTTLMGTTEGINQAKELARSINYTEALNYMSNAERLESMSSEQVANLNTVAAKMVADEKFSHIAGPVERMNNAATYIANLASDPAKNQAELSDIYSKAMDSMMAQNPVTTEVTEKVDKTKATLEQKGDEMKHKTDPAIEKVEKTTPRINPGNVGYTGKRPGENEIKRVDGVGFEERNRDYKNTIKNQEDPMGNFAGDAIARSKNDPRYLVPDPGQQKAQLPPGPTGPISGGPVKGSPHKGKLGGK